MSRHNHYYSCENCGSALGVSNGQYYHGMLLCDTCRAKAQHILENGRYDFTLAGIPSKGR